jgi:hypothetical protein
MRERRLGRRGRGDAGAHHWTRGILCGVPTTGESGWLAASGSPAACRPHAQGCEYAKIICIALSPKNARKINALNVSHR